MPLLHRSKPKHSRGVLPYVRGRRQRVCANQQIASDSKIPQVTVGKWRRSFAARGLDGLRNAPRSGSHRNTTPQSGRRCRRWPASNRNRKDAGACEHWRGKSAQYGPFILRSSELQPHRIRTLTFSPDPEFEPKLLDIVGLYLKPPESALVLCVDEKPRIQAWIERNLWLLLRAKKPRSWTNEYVRHGTQTMIVAVEIATGKVVAHVRNRRTSVNFLRFMNEVVRAYPERQLMLSWTI